MTPEQELNIRQASLRWDPPNPYALEALLVAYDVMKARVVAFKRSLHLCPDHQPEVWEGDGTCVLCESLQGWKHEERLSKQLTEMRADALLDDEVIADLQARIAALEQVLTSIIYASDGCVGHRNCNHTTEPWKRARILLNMQAEQEPKL